MTIGVDGKPHIDRQWMECFGQLVGTVLSLWEAAALDTARDNEEIVPTFLNLTDSTIRMVGISCNRSIIHYKLTSFID